MKRVLIITLLFAAVVLITAFNQPQQELVINKVQLGKQLFSEKMLSKDSSVSCASCHIPQFGFADTLALSKGIDSKFSSRNTPSVLNMKNRPLYFGMEELGPWKTNL